MTHIRPTPPDAPSWLKQLASLGSDPEPSIIAWAASHETLEMAWSSSSNPAAMIWVLGVVAPVEGVRFVCWLIHQELRRLNNEILNQDLVVALEDLWGSTYDPSRVARLEAIGFHVSRLARSKTTSVLIYLAANDLTHAALTLPKVRFLAPEVRDFDDVTAYMTIALSLSWAVEALTPTEEEKTQVAGILRYAVLCPTLPPTKTSP